MSDSVAALFLLVMLSMFLLLFVLWLLRLRVDWLEDKIDRMAEKQHRLQNQINSLDEDWHDDCRDADWWKGDGYRPEPE